jgi:hypothetical protein
LLPSPSAKHACCPAGQTPRTFNRRGRTEGVSIARARRRAAFEGPVDEELELRAELELLCAVDELALELLCRLLERTDDMLLDDDEAELLEETDDELDNELLKEDAEELLWEEELDCDELL